MSSAKPATTWNKNKGAKGGAEDLKWLAIKDNDYPAIQANVCQDPRFPPEPDYDAMVDAIGVITLYREYFEKAREKKFQELPPDEKAVTQVPTEMTQVGFFLKQVETVMMKAARDVRNQARISEYKRSRTEPKVENQAK